MWSQGFRKKRGTALLRRYMEECMFEKVKQLLADELNINPEEVTPESDLSADLGINSLELADLVLMCEEKFDIVIDDEDLHTFITVGDVANYLERTMN